MKALLTRKLGMTSILDADSGTAQAVTLLAASPNVVTQVKTPEADGYGALQLGFEARDERHTAKPQAGQFQAAKLPTLPKIIREFRVSELEEDLTVGSSQGSEVFSVGDVVDAVATSKGKGWAGTIKRHNFHRQRQTHGGKGNTRKPGSIGSMYPQHIFKGSRMAGQMGHERVTVKKLRIALVDNERQVIGVAGAVPGPRKGIVMIREVKS
jgi:large subunit ribosomal protein L3